MLNLRKIFNHYIEIFEVILVFLGRKELHSHFPAFHYMHCDIRQLAKLFVINLPSPLILYTAPIKCNLNCTY
jgi:hypothetical protein